ncbi:MAG TPA: helix-turn-helix transcriptional regulator [Cytophagales bacterium]|nr:helix-turn-helix transcriptional regulator [Cytophagales bacterium]
MENREIFLKENSELNKSTGYVFELPLKKDVLGKLIKALRKVRNYSQTKVGLLLGVQKAQISKLEKSDRNLTLSSIIKVFSALKAKISFKVELESKKEIIQLKEFFLEELKDSKDTFIKPPLAES